MRMNVVNRQDQPVLETVQSVQAAVLALEVVPLENPHSLLARQVWGRPREEFLELLEGHGSSFRGFGETPANCLGSLPPDEGMTFFLFTRFAALS
jgi:hypothetical protein